MNRYGVWIVLAAVLVAGCSKKAAEDTSLTAPGGFDTATTEELAQLPQASTNGSTQQTAIEVLPIETAPVTPPVEIQPAPVAAETSLDHNKKIQTALKNAGFYQGAVDGKIGPASKRAIEAFQKSNGLKVDGKVGPKTWAALEPYLSGSAPASETPAAS